MEIFNSMIGVLGTYIGFIRDFLISHPELLSFLEIHSALIGGFGIAISYIFQISRMLKTKRVDGISVLFWIVITVGLSFLLLNSLTVFILYGSWGYLVAEILNVSLALTVFFMVLYYRRKNKGK